MKNRLPSGKMVDLTRLKLFILVLVTVAGFAYIIQSKTSLLRVLPSQQPSPSNTTCNSTIVTAYYRIPSKHSHGEYLAWMENFLSLRDCMVIFCSPGMQDTLRALRPPTYPSLIIPRPIQGSSVIVTTGGCDMSFLMTLP